MGYLIVLAEKLPESCYDCCPCQDGDHYCKILQQSTTETIGEWRRLAECPLKFIASEEDLISYGKSQLQIRRSRRSN